MTKKRNDAEQNNLIIYKLEDGSVQVDAIFKDEILGLTQKTMSKVFDLQTPAISKHLKNIFDEKELEKESVVSKMEINAEDGNKYKTKIYFFNGWTLSKIL